MATPRKTGGRPRIANASPLTTVVANTTKGNTRRTASGRVCSNASAYPRASRPRGKPSPTNSTTKKIVLTPAATSASPASNTQALAGSRRHPPAHSLMA